MEALYLLIPLSVVAIFVAAWLFLRMSDSGQFDDMDGPAWSVLHDDDRPRQPAGPAVEQSLKPPSEQSPEQAPEPPSRPELGAQHLAHGQVDPAHEETRVEPRA